MVKAGKRVGLTVKVRAGFDPKSGGGGILDQAKKSNFELVEDGVRCVYEIVGS